MTPLCVPEADLKSEGRQSEAGLGGGGRLAPQPSCFHPGTDCGCSVQPRPPRPSSGDPPERDSPGSLARSCEGARAGRRWAGCSWLRVGSSFQEKGGHRRVGGFQAVSGSVHSLGGALGFRVGAGGQPVVPTDRTGFGQLRGEVASCPLRAGGPCAESTSQAVPGGTGIAGPGTTSPGGPASAPCPPGPCPALRKPVGGGPSVSYGNG